MKTTQKDYDKEPYSIESEQALLGSMLLNDNVSNSVCSKMQEDDLYNNIHKKIYGTIKELCKNRIPIDLVSVTTKLEERKQLGEIGGIDYLTKLTNSVPTATNYEYYLQTVLKHSRLRKLLNLTNMISAQIHDGEDEDKIISYYQNNITEITEKKSSGLTHIREDVEEISKKFNDIQKNPTVKKGLRTNFYALDKNFNGGLQNGDLILLAARPGVGKTTLAMNIITNVAINEKVTCAIFSLEMPRQQLVQRSLCSVGMVDLSKALNGELDNEDWLALWEARKRLSNSNIYIDDNSSMTVGSIIDECKKLKKEVGLDLIMIDYLQLMNAPDTSIPRQQQISEMTRNLKIAARELNVPILLLSQLSRDVEKRDDHRPMLSDLRESGAIEQDADIVMFIYNPDIYKKDDEYKPGIVDLMVAKHRNGEIGTIKLNFKKEYSIFTNQTVDSEMASLESTLPKIHYDAPSDKDAPPLIPIEDFSGIDIF